MLLFQCSHVSWHLLFPEPEKELPIYLLRYSILRKMQILSKFPPVSLQEVLKTG